MANNGRTVKVTGDYNIVAGQGNTILLDTGPNIGTVRVTGNLIVEGDTLTVEAQNLNVEDNIIILNYGEPGPGVTVGDGYSGIQIDRGANPDSSTVPPASFLWDESSEGWQLALGTPETGFNWSASKLRLKEILTDADTDDGDLTLIGAGLGVVKVVGTLNYEQRVTDDDDIPNKKYVDDAIESNPTFQIVKDDTRVIALDLNDPLDPAAFVPAIGPYSSMPTQSEVAVLVNNRRIAAFRQHSIEFTGLTIFTEDPVVDDIAAAMSGNYNPGPTATNLTGFENQSAVVLQADNTNTNIRLETNGTGRVVITYAQSFEHHGLSPSQVAGTSLIYGATPEAGTTGLRFVNTRPSKELDGTINASFTNDELVSKNRALLFSMLF
jgi:hypothetical protein